jgi:hypothetical protein
VRGSVLAHGARKSCAKKTGSTRKLGKSECMISRKIEVDYSTKTQMPSSFDA